MLRLHGLLKRLKRLIGRLSCRRAVEDEVRIKLGPLDMGVCRKIPTDIPYEITVVLPRIEIRRRCAKDNESSCECEILFNSITVAHSPREVGREGRTGGPVIDIPRDTR